MARLSKSMSQKEQDLLATIAEAKKKLDNLQQQQKLELGALVCKHGLQHYDTLVLDVAFKTLAMQLKNDQP